MKKQQSGFTLIELVIVIVILGILAAVAVPKYVDLSTEARLAALEGVAGAITSASSINYGARSAAPAKGVATVGLTCTSAATALLQGGIPSGYTLDTTSIATAGTTYTCLVTQTNGTTANAYIIGI